MMNGMQLLKGKFIWVHEPNSYFSNQSAMLLQHFDLQQYEDCVIVMLDYIRHSVKYFESIYPGKKIIIYQLEQIMGNAAHWWNMFDVMQNMKGAYEIWDYDSLNANNMAEFGVTVSKIVPMLYTESLSRIKSLEKPEIDVLFYGGLNERRFKIFQNLTSVLHNEASIVWLYGATGSRLDNHIANSKIILNLHMYEPWNRQEQARMFYPVINGKTVVSETSQNNNMYGSIIEVDTENLALMLKTFLKDEVWRYYGSFAKENFASSTERYVQSLIS